MNMFKGLAVAATVFTSLMASSVGAVTLTFKDSANLPTVINPMPVADATTGTVNEGVTGEIPGFRRDPFENTALAGIESYTSVQNDGSATYLTALSNIASFIWGSPDEYNTIEFKLGGTSQAVIDGTIGVRPPNGNGFSSVVLTTPFLFDELVFSNDPQNNAFEIANLSVGQVPLPAAAWLLIGAFGGLGILARRRTA